MSRPGSTQAGPGPVPCAAGPGTSGGQYVHPEGICACFWGGPAPVRAAAPEVAGLAGRPGVFDTSWIGQATSPRNRARGRVRAWLRRLFGRSGRPRQPFS
jgi:hypothetical protein